MFLKTFLQKKRSKLLNFSQKLFIINRFGKRGNANGYLNKEYVDFNMLRYLLQNPEVSL